MSEINGVGNLRQNGIKPLRSTAKARTSQDQNTVQTFEVEPGQGERTVREKYQGRSTPRSTRQNRNSDMPVEEQLGLLSKAQAAAKQYEAHFMNNLTKEMFKAPMGDMPGGETYRDIAMEPLRDYLSEAGGLGLADDIVNQIARQEGLERTLQQYPEVMGPNWQPRTPQNLMRKSAGGLEIGPDNQNLPAANDPAVKAETAPEAEQNSDTKPEKTAAVGLMGDEEIAWLYRDAADHLA